MVFYNREREREREGGGNRYDIWQSCQTINKFALKFNWQQTSSAFLISCKFFSIGASFISWRINSLSLISCHMSYAPISAQGTLERHSIGCFLMKTANCHRIRTVGRKRKRADCSRNNSTRKPTTWWGVAKSDDRRLLIPERPSSI